jgi:Arc/MetJ-type ribon-helix-helix transcriptional regulator
MTIQLSPETQKLLEEHMRRGGFPTADAALKAALETFGEVEGDAIEDLDEETQAAIARAEAQAERGEGRPWDEVKAELQSRFHKG